MAIVNKPNTFVQNTAANASEINDNFDTIYNEFNGSISAANLATSAVTTAKIADDAVTGAKIADNTVTEDNLTTAAAQGWYNLDDTPDTVTYNGNRNYTLTFNSNDLTDTLSEGMRLRFTRTVAAPTQCTDLESGSSQYFSSASAGLNGCTFTDDWTCMAWIKLESYPTSGNYFGIISRNNGTNGWNFRLNSDGQIEIYGTNGAGANYRRLKSYQSVPLGRWVHVAAHMDMSTYTTATCKVFMDGIEVTGVLDQGGTNPTSLIQAGDINVGALNAGSFFDGKIAQASVWSTKLSGSDIRTYFTTHTLAGNEANLVSAYSCNNSLLDLNTTNNNDLSASGSATMTSSDSPFATSSDGTPTGTIDYGIVMDVSFSTNTTLVVQVPEGNTIPTSGGVTSVDYSVHNTPYGFVKEDGRWEVLCFSKVSISTSIGATGSWYGQTELGLTVPIGPWRITMQSCFTQRSTVAGARNGYFTLADSTYLPIVNGVYSHPLAAALYDPANSSASLGSLYTSYAVRQSTSSLYNPYCQINATTGTETWETRGDRSSVLFKAVPSVL